MTGGEPFVAQLRTRGDTIELASPGGPAITVRIAGGEPMNSRRASSIIAIDGSSARSVTKTTSNFG